MVDRHARGNQTSRPSCQTGKRPETLRRASGQRRAGGLDVEAKFTTLDFNDSAPSLFEASQMRGLMGIALFLQQHYILAVFSRLRARTTHVSHIKGGRVDAAHETHDI